MRDRKLWADYFDGQGIKYAFFSAANAAALQEARREAAEAEAKLYEHQAVESAPTESGPLGPATSAASDEDADSSDESDVPDDDDDISSSEGGEDYGRGAFLPIDDEVDAQDPRTKVLSVLQLEDLFVASAPDLSSASTTINQIILSE